jgi:hypothetical protein
MVIMILRKMGWGIAGIGIVAGLVLWVLRAISLGDAIMVAVAAIVTGITMARAHLLGVPWFQDALRDLEKALNDKKANRDGR